MQNITLSLPEDLLEAARRRAAAEGTTLEALIERWLAAYAGRSWQADRALAIIQELRGTIDTSGRKLTRDEMNER